ncbi:MAG: hypothetical protein HYV02_00645 [Deltaproteobacteria bacterium]|nr:hypothetical protein [Deltaproteobacteria bacterium]
MIVGREEKNKSAIGLDFILPDMPWFACGLSRAEQNNVDFGFGKLPCLTVEDLILSKLFLFANDKTRFNDLDDLQSIFLAEQPLDLAYLSGQMRRLCLDIPVPIHEMAPSVLKLVSKKIKKGN